MLAPKVNKKKNTINSIMLVVILLIIFVVVYKNFIAGKQGSATKNESAAAGILNTAIKPVEKIKKDNFSLDVLDDEKFLNLVEFKYQNKPISELKIGKDDPFKVDELIDAANNESDKKTIK
jgi:hypothetical protein